MRTAMAETSLVSYREHQSSMRLSAQEQAVLHFLTKHAHLGFSRNEIAELSGIRLSAVCGRVNMLVKIGLVDELPPRPDRFTGKMAKPVRAAAMQSDLFAARPVKPATVRFVASTYSPASAARRGPTFVPRRSTSASRGCDGEPP